MHQALSALVAILSLAASSCLQCGCSGARQRIQDAQAAYVSGDAERGYAILADPAAQSARRETRDRLLWLMEEGKMAQDTGRFAESEAALRAASELADRFDEEWDKTSVGEELGAMVVNQNVRVFRGSYADRIEVETARMLAALGRGDFAGALVAARRAIERQVDAEVDQAKRIAAYEKEIDKRGGNEAVQEILGRQGVDLSQAYAPYLNPVASWLAGILQCATGDGNDRQRGETSLRRALAMAPENAALLAEVERNPWDLAREGDAQVLVVFENGVGPQLVQITIPLVTPWLGLSTIPLPSMQFAPRPAESIQVSTTRGAVRTEELANYDLIWKRDFDQRLPEIILRTALMIAAKEGATYAAYEATRRGNRDDSYNAATWAVLIAASIYKGVTNEADLRTWRSIPAEVQIAQVARPSDGVAEVCLVVGGRLSDCRAVSLPDSPISLVWARCTVPGRLDVRTFPIPSSMRQSDAPSMATAMAQERLPNATTPN